MRQLDNKLEDMARVNGFTVNEMVERLSKHQHCAPGLCINQQCDYTTVVAKNGDDWMPEYCPICRVMSILAVPKIAQLMSKDQP